MANQKKIDGRSRKRPRLIRHNPLFIFLISLILALLILFLRTYFSQFFGVNRNTYIVFYPAVMLFALFGGWIAGLTATIIFALGAMYYLLPPLYNLQIHDSFQMLGSFIFTITCLIITFVCDSLRRARNTAEFQKQQSQYISEELREAKEQLQTILENVADGIVVRDGKGKPIYANKAAIDLFGLSQLKKKHFLLINELDRVYKITDNSGKKVPSNKLPVARILHGEQRAEAILLFKNKKTKHEKWFMTRARGIKNKHDKLNYVIAVFADITESRNLEKQKDDFIGIASHELKTPVTSLKAYTQALQRRFSKAGLDKEAGYLEKMDTQVNKLSLLIEDLLDISRMEGSRYQIHQQQFDLNELIHEVVEETQRTAEKHKIIKELVETKTLYADRERTGQVITNLLTNAIKYSPQADKIIVSSETNSKYITVHVKDFGGGIPEDKQKKVFQRYYRETGHKEITVPGLGLGLYISSEIIKRQGGDIWVESAVGKGSTFSFSLPLRK